MRINSIISILKSQILQRKHTKPTKKAYINIKDSVKISKAGKTLQKDKAGFLFAKKALSQVPDIRPDKVESALSKIENKYYNNYSAKEGLAKKLLDTDIFKPELNKNKVISGFKAELKNISDVRKNRLVEIRNRLKSNFYNRKDVIAKLSDKILKDFGI